MAAEDARYFIAPRGRPGDSWTDDAFYASGEALVESLVAFADPPGRDLAVEIGCGVGRNLFSLGKHFSRAIGFDISEEMVRRAQSSPLRPENVHVELTGGRKLTGLESDAVDLVLSVIVFQHIAEYGAIEHYLQEVGRVLRPRGRGVLHFDTRPPSLARRAYMSLPDALVAKRHRRGMRRHPRPAELVRASIGAAGLGIVQETGPDSPFHFFLVERPG